MFILTNKFQESGIIPKRKILMFCIFLSQFYYYISIYANNFQRKFVFYLQKDCFLTNDDYTRGVKSMSGKTFFCYCENDATILFPMKSFR